MIGSRLKFSLAVVAVALASWSASAQDPKPEPAKPPESSPPAPETPKPDHAALLQRMQHLYSQAAQPPQADVGAQGEDPQKALAAAIKREKEWDKALADLAKAGDEYFAALGDAAPDARALYYRGVGHLLWSTRRAPDKVGSLRKSVESLDRFLQSADEKAAFRADAEMHLGKALVFLAPKEPGRLDEAIPHLRKAVELLQKDARHEEAGEAAWFGLSSLRSAGRDAELGAFVAATNARTADFGAWTEGNRVAAKGAEFSVGSRLPALQNLKDVDGKEISFDPAGKPLLVHFFLTNYGNGMATPFREIETEVRPLFERYREKGVRFVGVCMDYAFPKEVADAKRAEWKELGRPGEFRDGSLEAARAWTAKKGVEWQWYWDGMWTKNPVSTALGGIAVNAPFAFLLDKDGVVIWKGDAPFKDLPEALAKLAK